MLDSSRFNLFFDKAKPNKQLTRKPAATQTKKKVIPPPKHQEDDMKICSIITNYIYEYYESDIKEVIRLNKGSISFDFMHLVQYEVELAEKLLESFEDTHTLFRLMLKNYDARLEKVMPRFTNFPESQGKEIWKLRKIDLGKFRVLKGYIRKISDVFHGVSEISYECPSCSNKINIPQSGKEIKRVTRCGCGRKTGFKELSRVHYDLQKLILEEDISDMEDQAQKPRRILVLLKHDLCKANIDKTLQPSRKIKISGIVSDQELRKGSVEYKKYLEAHNLTIIDETYAAITVTEDDIEKFNEVSKDPKLYDYMSQSMFPTIHGNDMIKKALFLQLVGGVHIYDPRGQLEERGLVHILLVGSPGCLAEGTYITTSKGEFKRIESYGSYHLEEINKLVLLDRTSQNSKLTGKAIQFHIYPDQEAITITTQTGKEITCNLIHPFYVKNKHGKNWVKAKDLCIGDKLKVSKKTRCNKTAYEKYQGIICDEDIALVTGLAIGDGSRSKYRLSYHFCEDEVECISKTKRIFSMKFNKLPYEQLRLIPPSKINDRIINRTKKQHVLQYNSKQLASFFKMEKQPTREIPDWVMMSKNSVVGMFLKGLFEADGCCCITRRKINDNRLDCARISLKSTSKKLLLQAQLLFTRFGIQGRVKSEVLTICNSKDIILYNKYIGFISERKKTKLKEATRLASIPKRKRRKLLYEKVIDIKPVGKITVYDITIDAVHKYLSNGILSHNTAKSQLLKKTITFMPNGRFASGKGISGVGLVASLSKDDEMGWGVEAGIVPICNHSIVSLDECDKINKEDLAHLNNAMQDLFVVIDKATIHCKFETYTMILAAANPVNRVFDSREPVWRQIGLPKDFLDRFDLIFPVDAMKTETEQRKVANLIFSKYRDGAETQPRFEHEFVKKYIAYARQNYSPVLSADVEPYIIDNFINLISPTYDEEQAYFSSRLLTNIIRLSTAAAKARLSHIVEIKDATFAMECVMDSFKRQDIISSSGLVRLDKLEEIVPKSERDKLYTVKDVIKNLSNAGDPVIEVQDIIKLSIEKLNMTEDDVENILATMKKQGDVFEPIQGKVRLI